jgi:hypothetical protein
VATTDLQGFKGLVFHAIGRMGFPRNRIGAYVLSSLD